MKFTEDGFPDFTPYAMELKNGKKWVEIEMTGVRELDRKAANKAASFDRTPAGWVWHHQDELGKMVLVPEPVHDAVAHTGGAAKWTENTGIRYE